MYVEDPAIVISLKWKLTKRLLHSPMLSPVVMPVTLTRNDWKQKHGKPLKRLSWSSVSEVTELKEAYTEQMAYTIHSHRRAMLAQTPREVLDIPGAEFKHICEGMMWSEVREQQRWQVTELSLQPTGLGLVQVCHRYRSTARRLSTTSVKWRFLSEVVTCQPTANWQPKLRCQRLRGLESDLSFNI